MSANPVQGTGSAPVPVQHIKLLSVPKQGIAFVRLLGPASGILTHWARERPVACPGESKCPTALHRASTCWKGYAPAEEWLPEPQSVWLPCVLEITERLWELLENQTLRGQVWELFRAAGDHKRSEVTGRLIDLVDPRQLRTDVEILPVVCRVYRTVNIEWGVKPIMPARLALAPSAGLPPPNATAQLDPHEVVGSPEWEADMVKAREALKAALRPQRNGSEKGGKR